MFERYTTVLEMANFDWCFNCAMGVLEKKNDKKKAFAWIFIQYARIVQEMVKKHTHYTIGDYTCIIKMDSDIFVEWDIPFFKKEKTTARYYEFLTPMFEEHFLNFAQMTTSHYGYAFDKEHNLIITCKVEE